MHLNFVLSSTVCFLSARQIEFRRKTALGQREYPENANFVVTKTSHVHSFWEL